MIKIIKWRENKLPKIFFHYVKQINKSKMKKNYIKLIFKRILHFSHIMIKLMNILTKKINKNSIIIYKLEELMIRIYV